MEVVQIIKKGDWISHHAINRSIDARINNLFFIGKRNKLSFTYGKIVQSECKKLARPFIELVRFHEQYRDRAGYRKGASVIAGLYDKFFRQYKQLLRKYKSAPCFEDILETWDAIVVLQKRKAILFNNIGLYSLMYQLRTDMIKYYHRSKIDKFGAKQPFSDSKEAQANKILEEIVNRGGLDVIAARYCLKNPELIEEYIHKCKQYAMSKPQQAFWGKELTRMILDY